MMNSYKSWGLGGRSGRIQEQESRRGQGSGRGVGVQGSRRELGVQGVQEGLGVQKGSGGSGGGLGPRRGLGFKRGWSSGGVGSRRELGTSEGGFGVWEGVWVGV